MISDKNTLDLNLLCFFWTEHDIDNPPKKIHEYQDFPTQRKIGRLDVLLKSNAKNRPFVTWDLLFPPWFTCRQALELPNGAAGWCQTAWWSNRIVGVKYQVLPTDLLKGVFKSDLFRGELYKWPPFGESKGHLEEAGTWKIPCTCWLIRDLLISAIYIVAIFEKWTRHQDRTFIAKVLSNKVKLKDDWIITLSVRIPFQILS